MGENGKKWGKMGGNGGKWGFVTNTSWKIYENVPERKKNEGKWGGGVCEKWAKNG